MKIKKEKQRMIAIRSTSGLDTNMAFVLSTSQPISYRYGQTPSKKNKKDRKYDVKVSKK